MSIPVVEELRPTPLGVVLALYPALGAHEPIELERAPESGGVPDIGNVVGIAVLPPGERLHVDLVGAAGPWHYRARHARYNATAGAWTLWVKARPTVIPALLPNIPETAEVMAGEIGFDANGQVVASVAADYDSANIYLTVGDGVAPSDPTAASNHGTVAGRSGTISTTQKITTGNEAYVKIVAADSFGNLGEVRTFRQPRRLGPFHRDVSSRSVTGTTSETTMQTVTVSANRLGTNGSIRLTVHFSGSGIAGTKTLRLKFGGTTLFTLVIPATSVQATLGSMLLLNTATNAQTALVEWDYDSGPKRSFSSNVAAIDTTASADLVVTCQLANGADQMNLVLSLAEYLGTN